MGFLPCISLHGPRNKDNSAGKILSIKDLVIRIKLAMGCTCASIFIAAAELLFSCNTMHSVLFIPNVTLQVRNVIKSVKILPVIKLYNSV